MIPYDYITSSLAVTSSGVEQFSLSADTDEPIVPLPFRHVIVLHALKNWYRDKKDDARGDVVGKEYADLMLRITGDQEIGRSLPQITPRRGPYVEAASRPYRRRLSRYTVGSTFDELRDS